MKNLIAICLMMMLGSTFAQTLNEKGLYTDNEGHLFSGLLTSLNNGVKSELQVINGVINGTATYYYASGKLMESGYMSNNSKDGKWTRYSENGIITAVGFYSSGKKNGNWTIYDETGKKRMEMNYSNGEKSGTWTSWDENGSIVSTKAFGGAN